MDFALERGSGKKGTAGVKGGTPAEVSVGGEVSSSAAKKATVKFGGLPELCECDRMGYRRQLGRVDSDVSDKEKADFGIKPGDICVVSDTTEGWCSLEMPEERLCPIGGDEETEAAMSEAVDRAPEIVEPEPSPSADPEPSQPAQAR